MTSDSIQHIKLVLTGTVAGDRLGVEGGGQVHIVGDGVGGLEVEVGDCCD